MEIIVVNKYHKESGEYIGRGSPLGNPYSHQKGTTAIYQTANRYDSVRSYKDWLDGKIAEEDPAILNELMRLFELAQQGPLKLACFCAPQKCHGEIIRDVLLKANETYLQNNP